MVVCKFFLEGSCNLGDVCNFEHEIIDTFNNYQNVKSILRQPNFSTTPQPAQPAASPVQASSSTTTSAVDTATLVESVVNDMTSAEKGGQWPLSCYAPFKEKPAFPGFEDHSFEELRFAYYEAMKSGSIEQYKQQVRLMIQQIQMKIKSLQNPSPDMVNLLKNIYETPPSSQSGVFLINRVNSANTTSLNLQSKGFVQQGTCFEHHRQQGSGFGQQGGEPNVLTVIDKLFSEKVFKCCQTKPNKALFCVECGNSYHISCAMKNKLKCVKICDTRINCCYQRQNFNETEKLRQENILLKRILGEKENQVTMEIDYLKQLLHEVKDKNRILIVNNGLLLEKIRNLEDKKNSQLKEEFGDETPTHSNWAKKVSKDANHNMVQLKNDLSRNSSDIPNQMATEANLSEKSKIEVELADVSAVSTQIVNKNKLNFETDKETP